MCKCHIFLNTRKHTSTYKVLLLIVIHVKGETVNQLVDQQIVNQHVDVPASHVGIFWGDFLSYVTVNRLYLGFGL